MYDGATWTSPAISGAFSPREEFSLTAFQDRLYVVGGTSILAGAVNDVWSFDGTSFTLVTGAADFAPRSAHAAVAYHDRLYVIGGRTSDSAPPTNDVWSWDGASGSAWTMAPGGFPLRYGHAMSVVNDTIVLTCGMNGQMALKDALQFNGTTWDSLMPPFFHARGFPSSVAFRSRLYVFAGKDTTGMNDVYYNDLTTWSSAEQGMWPARSKQSVILNPFADGDSPPGESMLLIGGELSSGAVTNDVWTLKEIAPPGAPTGVVAVAIQSPNTTAPSNSIAVSWVPSTSTGGAPILAYVVTNSFDLITAQTTSSGDSASSSSIQPPATTVVVTGLSWDRNYTFYVRSENLAGSSPSSGASNVQATAAAGYLVNGGGRISVNATTVVASSGASRSTSPITQAWFIALMVFLSVLVFVLLCFVVVRRHLSQANRDLERLDEIEGLEDDDDDEDDDGEEEDAGEDAQNADEFKDAREPNGRKDRPRTAGASAAFPPRPRSARTAPTTPATPKSIPLASGQLDLAQLGIQMSKRDKRWEIERWKRGLDTDASSFSAASSSSTLPSSPSTAASSIFLRAPLGFPFGSARESEAIEKLGHEWRRVRREEERKERRWRKEVEREVRGGATEEDVQGEGDASDDGADVAPPAPPSDAAIRQLCSASVGALLAALSREYSQRLQRDPSAPRMLPTEEMRTVLEHAFFASTVMKFLTRPTPTAAGGGGDVDGGAYGRAMEKYAEERDELQQVVFDALVDEVSRDAAELRAMRGALDAASDTGGGTGGDGGGEDYLFLLTRAHILRWMFQTTKATQERLGETIRTGGGGGGGGGARPKSRSSKSKPQQLQLQIEQFRPTAGSSSRSTAHMSLDLDDPTRDRAAERHF